MGKGSSKSKSLVEQPRERLLSKAFFPQVNSPKVLINILECLYPHEILCIQYANTYIYEFLNDDMIWMRLISKNKRMYLITPNFVHFFYPYSEMPSIKMPLKSAVTLPQQYASVETCEHKLFFIGGFFEGEGGQTPTADVFEYLERKARIEQRERMTEDRFNVSLAVRQNEIFVMGGENGKEMLLNCEKYIISDNIWISIAFLLSPINKGVLFAIGEFVYHMEPDSSRHLSLYIYSCNENSWDMKSLPLPLELVALNFCEFGDAPGNVIIFGESALVSLNIDDFEISYSSDRDTYKTPVKMRNSSHIKLHGTTYAINDKTLLRREAASQVEAIINPTFEAITAALKAKQPQK